MLTSFRFSLLFIIGTTLFDSSASETIARDLIILTDMEPDDRIALAMVANRPELSKRLKFVGTTLLNTPLKAELAKRQLEQSGLDHVPVYAGTGSPPSSYPNNVETAKAALKFWHEEGNGILTDEELKKFREIYPEENVSLSDDEMIAGIDPVEDIWSIIIEGIKESAAPKQQDCRQDDYRAAIRLLDIMNIATPPKYVYRMSKPGGVLTPGPRPLKVFFPVSYVTPTIMTIWNEDSKRFRKQWKEYWKKTRKESDIPQLQIYFGMSTDDFDNAKSRFIEGKNKAIYTEDSEQSSDIHLEKDERNKTDREKALPHLADIDRDEITEFMVYDEKKRSIIIIGLPDNTDATLLPSQRYNRDFRSVTDILYTMGVEKSPLAIRRLGFEIFAEGGRNTQVIFHNRKIARIALLAWNKYKYIIRGRISRPEWKMIIIKEFEIEPKPAGNKIENTEQLSDMLGYIKDTPIQTSNHSKALKNKAEQKQVVFPTNQLQNALIETLSKAKKNSIEILLMTAPIDLVQVLDAKPELIRAIRRVHLMGGWVELKAPQLSVNQQEQPPPTIWGSYNLNMASESSKRLFAMASREGEEALPLRLYTYRHVWENFQGSVNRETFSATIKIITTSRSQVLKDFLKAAITWDEHAMRVMPYLTRFIGPYAGEQFSPADPILVVGLLKPESFIKERRQIKVNVEHEQLDVLNDVLEVQIEYDLPNSNIELITALNVGVFREQLGYSLVPCNKCKLFGHFGTECPNNRPFRDGGTGLNPTRHKSSAGVVGRVINHNKNASISALTVSPSGIGQPIANAGSSKQNQIDGSTDSSVSSSIFSPTVIEEGEGLKATYKSVLAGGIGSTPLVIRPPPDTSGNYGRQKQSESSTDQGSSKCGGTPNAVGIGDVGRPEQTDTKFTLNADQFPALSASRERKQQDGNRQEHPPRSHQQFGAGGEVGGNWRGRGYVRGGRGFGRQNRGGGSVPRNNDDGQRNKIVGSIGHMNPSILGPPPNTDGGTRPEPSRSGPSTEPKSIARGGGGSVVGAGRGVSRGRGGFGRNDTGVVQRGPVDLRTKFYNGPAPGPSNRKQPSDTVRKVEKQNLVAKEFKLDNDQFPAIGTVQKNMKNGRK